MCFFFSFLYYAGSPECTSLLLATIAPTIYCEPNKINVLLWQRKCTLFPSVVPTFIPHLDPSFNQLWALSALGKDIRELMSHRPTRALLGQEGTGCIPSPQGSTWQNLNGNFSDLCLKVRKWIIGLDQDLLVLSPNEGTGIKLMAAW